MSIDREINQRVEAYSSNPGALQKRYATSKELIDLLALQRLKSQKDDAARKIQMEMEQMPGTIKAQREAELMGQNVQDLTKRTSETMRSMAQKKQMKAMQKGAAERAKGLASLTGNPQMAMAQQNRPQQAQPQQPQRMQAGGIVALRDGGDVETKRKIQSLINQGKSDEEIRQAMAELGLLPQAADRVIKMVREQRREDMASAPKKEEPRRGGRLAESGRVEEKAREKAPRPELNVFDEAKQEDIEELKRRGVLRPDFEGSISSKRAEKMLARAEQTPPQGIAAVAEQPPESFGVRRSDANKPSTDSIVDKLITPQEAPVAQQAGMEAGAQERIPESAIQRVENGQAQPVPQLKPETISTERTFDLSRDMLKEVGLDPSTIDPSAEGITARDDTMKYLSEVVKPDGTKTTKDAEMRERLAGLEALDKAQQDPDKLRRERLMARMIAGSQGGLGSAAAGGARAAQSQGRALRARELERMKLLGEIQDRDNTLRLNATKAQQEAFAEHSANRRAAVNALATGSAAEIRRRTAEAQMKMEANQGNIANKLKRLEIDAIDADRRLRATEGSIEDTQGLLADTVRRLGEARAEFVNDDENYKAVQREANLVLQDAESSEEDRNAATKRKQDARSAAVLAFESAMGTQYPQLTKLIENLEADLVSLKARRRGFSDPETASTPVTLSSTKASDAYTRNIGG